MPVLRIPAPLRSYTSGQTEVTVSGDTVAEAMLDLARQHPGLRQHIYNPRGELRPFVNIFLGQQNVKDLQGLDTPLPPDASLRIVPSIAGG